MSGRDESGGGDFRPPGEIPVPISDDEMEDKHRGKRVAEGADSPSVRQKGQSPGFTLDDIRGLLQQQTQVLRESQPRRCRT